MEHEVFVPVPAERLREVLDDPARVARAVPGLQQDAGAEPVAGRLKIRVGSHSVTYRGAVRVTRRDDGCYTAEGEAEESRGSGSVTLALRIALREAEDGATLVFTGTASADGRIEDLPADQVEGAVTRLLHRFAEHLAEAAPETTTSLATQDTEAAEEPDRPSEPGEGPPASGPADGSGAAGPGGEASASGSEERPAPPEPPAVHGSGAPSSPLRPRSEGAEDDEDDIAEAAHARRTMIGRSAEEVDHAPPRGRYAPVPAPQTVTPPAPLRWAAPAAALAVASAIVAVRALRRRR